MKQWYDKEEDIFNIQLKQSGYWKSIELPKGVVIDVGFWPAFNVADAAITVAVIGLIVYEWRK